MLLASIIGFLLCLGTFWTPLERILFQTFYAENGFFPAPQPEEQEREFR